MILDLGTLYSLALETVAECTGHQVVIPSEREGKVLPTSFPRRRESSNTMPKQPTVYILASKRNGTLPDKDIRGQVYIGVTSDLQKRAWKHKNDLVEGFTRRYGVHRLAYYELHEDMMSAIL